MTTAIIISGQPRFLEECYPYIYENLLKPNGMPDVFAHLWWSEEDCKKTYKYGGNGGWAAQRINENAIELFEKLYKPKKIKIEPSKIWAYSNIDYSTTINTYQKGALTEPDSPIQRIFSNSISMWKSIFEANKLKKEYEWETDKRYDYIIRTRSDLIIRTPIVCSKLDKNKFHYAEIGQPSTCVSDWINIANTTHMDIACRCWYDYEHIVSTHLDNGKIPYGNEVLLKKQLEANAIKIEPHYWSVALPRF